MKFYKSVEMPDWCFLSEAVHFVAFGTVPEIDWYDIPVPDEVGRPVGIDRRFHWKEMPDNFTNNMIEFEFYEPEDFLAAGIEIPIGYAEAAVSVLYGEINDAYHTIKFHEKYHERIDWEAEEKVERMNAYTEAKKIISNAGQTEILFEKTNALFDVHLEKVWARIFSSIHAEDLVVEGLDFLRWEELSDAGEYHDAAEFKSIPSEAFRLNHDFKQDEVSFDDRLYVATRVNVDQLIEVFSGSFLAGQPSSAREFGHALIVEGDFPRVSNKSSSKPRRGAPHALDWAKMEARLRSMAETDALPIKKDACIYELIEFADTHLGRKVGRTTVQTRLKSVLNEIYARN